jgi:hypothetical protein
MSRLFKVFKNTDRLYKMSVLALLLAIATFQWQQMRAIQNLDYITAEIANREIAVTNHT